MAEPSGISWGVEVYRAIVYPLNADGSMQQSNDAQPYEGLQFEGSRVFEITPAEPRAVDNYGDGRLRDTIYLPPNTANKGVLRVGYDHQPINAALTGVNNVTTGDMKWTPMGTDKQGTEPVVALLLMQMGRDENKLKRWRWYMIPRAQCIPLPSSFNENGTEMTYQITMSPSTVTIWNQALTLEIHNCLEHAYADGVSEYRPHVVAFEGDGAYDVVFNLPTSKPAFSTSKMKVFNYLTGVEVTTGITKTTTSVTFDVAPDYPFTVVYEF